MIKGHTIFASIAVSFDALERWKARKKYYYSPIDQSSNYTISYSALKRVFKVQNPTRNDWGKEILTEVYDKRIHTDSSSKKYLEYSQMIW